MNNENCSDVAHSRHSLSDQSQGALSEEACRSQQQLLNAYPNSESSQQFTHFDSDPQLQELLNTLYTYTHQDGGALPSTSGPSTTSATPTDAIEPIQTPPSDTPSLSAVDIEALIRDGGTVNDFHVYPRPRFNSVELQRSMNLREIRATDLASYHIRLHDTMNEMVTFARRIGGDNSVINFTLRGPRLNSDVSVILSPGNNYDVTIFTDQIEKILQSDERLLCDDMVEIGATVAMNRQGGVRRKLTDLALDQVIKRKKTSLFCPMNISNNLCFSICLAHFLDPALPESDLERRAAVIQNDTGFSIQDKIGLCDIAKFESLYDVKIVVFYRTTDGPVETFANQSDPHPKTLHLYLHDEHFYTILNLKAFIGSNYVCRFCYKGYNDVKHHHCSRICNVCFDPDCYKHPKRTVHCADCLRFCKSDYCYKAHKKISRGRDRVPCDMIKYCKLCNRRYDVSGARDNHKCKPVQCVHCGEDLGTEGLHQCFIRPINPKDTSEKYIFYDFETRYENGKHVANFVCAITFQGEKFVAEGPYCVSYLINHFRQRRYKGYTFIAHYASKFDSFLILEYFCKAGLTLDIIMQGCKLIYMYDSVYAQRYIDSYSFIPMALSKMPAALNLTTTEKGYFPHHFNRVENESYVGPYPDKKFYGYDNMTDKNQAKFDEWYATVTGKFFDFKKELKEYGVNDVVLLREACMKYRDAFIACTELDPFNFTTLASCCMGVFKTHYLDSKTLALTHNNAYVQKSKTYSNASIEWLEYVKKTRNLDIHHALNHGEVSIGKYYLDGFAEFQGTRYGLEFAGCMFHGHSCQYPSHYTHPMSAVPYGVLRRQFDEKVDILQNAYGLKIEVMWECEWTKMKRDDPSVKEFMSTYSAPERLKPRDALFGGRTNAYKLYHKTAEGERISYVDFTSLYPFCQSTKTYPIGHPEIIFNDFEPIENYYGLIKAVVYPPRKLLHPVLPYRCNGKLFFPLCRTCAHSENQTSCCSHTDEERALSGSWVSIELLKAVEKGYVIARIDEVWHFPQRSDNLFREYVKTFLRLKQQASGYPANVVTDADKAKYIRDYYKKEGIRLDPEKISYNPAQRSINKLLLNSLWGRFSMRENLPKTLLVKKPEDFTRIVFNATTSLKYFTFVSDDVALVQFQKPEGELCKTNDINVFVGAFTTAHARLELYELMDKLGDRLLYSDTDSVIFVSRDGDWDPPLGDYLGELTNELDDGDFITEFCSSGPKSYGYRTAKGKVTMKAKGITLNAKNSQTIRLDTLIDLVDGYAKSRYNSRCLLAHTENIVRDKKHLTLHNKSVVKRFRVVYNKRRLLGNFSSVPYGF
ncbi:uncharacterized protein [Paramisgurnus dabryanus]|uniref:uncharacterized protein n=1 Tax=Paramisgurnus dabryanus TaxID=90735 RepID=UPI0031F38662